MPPEDCQFVTRSIRCHENELRNPILVYKNQKNVLFVYENSPGKKKY